LRTRQPSIRTGSPLTVQLSRRRTIAWGLLSFRSALAQNSGLVETIEGGERIRSNVGGVLCPGTIRAPNGRMCLVRGFSESERFGGTSGIKKRA
jgi:hypothetical protein